MKTEETKPESIKGYTHSNLDAILTELETVVYKHRFQTYFPKLSDILATGRGVSKGEMSELKNRFNSYFPHLSDLLSASRASLLQ
jgi:hypothetical protein